MEKELSRIISIIDVYKWVFGVYITVTVSSFVSVIIFLFKYVSKWHQDLEEQVRDSAKDLEAKIEKTINDFKSELRGKVNGFGRQDDKLSEKVNEIDKEMVSLSKDVENIRDICERNHPRV